MPTVSFHDAEKRAIISLGGSLIVPDDINVEYLKKFRQFILKQINAGWRFLIITGGGAPAREYQQAAKGVLGKEITDDDMDWLGIHATRFNAHLVRTIFRSQAQPAIITDAEEDALDPDMPVIVVSGWKPGWSTDYVATVMAKRTGATLVFNLSNIDKVYTGDPRTDASATPIDEISWDDYCQMVGDEWTPGMNVPFDPIAAKLARESNIQVIVVGGRDLDNLDSVFNTGEFNGTLIQN